MLELIRQMFTFTFGLVMVGGMLAFIYKRFAIDWEELSRVYARPWQAPREQRRFTNMILYSEGRPARSYKGVVQIGLYPDGIALRPNRFLVPFHPPIFIPFEDIRGWDQRWYLDARSTELSFRKTPHMRVIMPQKQVEWMIAGACKPVPVSSARPPHGTRPWLTHYLALGSGGLAVMMIAALIARGIEPVSGSEPEGLEPTQAAAHQTSYHPSAFSSYAPSTQLCIEGRFQIASA